MKVLFLHPEDSPERGPWTRERWDRVIDLGMAGPDAYERWSAFFGCPVTSSAFASLPSKPVREALAAGLGVILDTLGIDWWEILSAVYLQRLYEILTLRQMLDDLTGECELAISRDCFHARVLEVLADRTVRAFSHRSGPISRLGTLHRKFQRLSLTQIRQIITDKYDPQHKFRATIANERTSAGLPVILLPTAYVNVSRTALAYADTLPESRFLLMAARRSGWRNDVPPNVIQSDLASYFHSSLHACDHDELVSRLPRLIGQLEQNALCRVLAGIQMFDRLEKDLRRWLVVRDAWLNVFDSEPITSVLCCDGTNPYTLIPLLIAKHHGIPAILSHHGALDGHYLVKRNPADFILAKGEMERDYLVRRCGIPDKQVVIGAAAPPPDALRATQSHIIFFSEDYEVSGGRVPEFYRSLLPGLAKLAEENSKLLVLKLHPAENSRERRRIAKSILPLEQFRRLRIVDGPLTEDLMADAWFAVAGISTTAMDCATRGIPVFLCSWLENWPYRYLDQFAKFGVGAKLETPDELEMIPAMLRRLRVCDPLKLWNPITPEQFDALLGSGASVEMAAAI